MTTPDYWAKARTFLSNSDPVMRKLIDTYEGEMLATRGDPFYTLARSIAGQQISVKAADAVWLRIENHLHGITPKHFLEASGEELRSCGMSRQKILYLKNIAEHFATIDNPEQYFSDMTDDEVMKELISIKGVGKWTAEMFLIFCLMRKDVFPLDDIGVQKAIVQLYGPMEKSDMTAHAEHWRPYRTVATWYLWRALDPVPVAY